MNFYRNEFLLEQISIVTNFRIEQIQNETNIKSEQMERISI
jgi:hypothetical protein